MTGVQVGVICTVIGTVVLVAGYLRNLYRTNRARRAAEARRTTKEAKDRADELAAAKAEGFTAGVASRVPFEDRLRDQRDDARHERDNERADRIAAQARVQQLEDQRRGGT